MTEERERFHYLIGWSGLAARGLIFLLEKIFYKKGVL